MTRARAQARAEHAQALLDQWLSEGVDFDPLEELVQYRWAIVTRRNDDAWVNGINTWEDVARHEHSTLIGPEYDIEWIEGVFDLDTGKPVSYERRVLVEIKVDGQVVAFSESK